MDRVLAGKAVLVTGAGPEIAAEKQRIREATLTARRAMAETLRTEAGIAIAGHGLDRWSNAERVAAFVDSQEL